MGTHTLDSVRRLQKFTLCTVINTYFVQPSIIIAFGNGEPFAQTRYHFD